MASSTTSRRARIGAFAPMVVLLMSAIVACQGTATSASPVPGSSATAGSSPGAQAALADVPMYRMDPAHLGVQPGPGPDGQPQLVWSAKAGGGIETSPILGGGTLFVGSDDGNLYALDARTGADRWRLAVGAPVSSAPVYGDGVVAVADGNGILHGVDASTGLERWRTAAVVNAAAPVLVGGTIYIAGNDKHAHGFDLQSGAETWSWAATASLGGALAIAADTAYVATVDGMLHAIDLADSREFWSYQLSSNHVGYPIVAGDVVLVNALQGSGEPSGELFALDRTSGALLWRFRGPSGLQISLGSVRDGIVYAPTQSDGIYAFHIADGSQVWHAAGPTVFFPTALVADILYMTSESPPEIAAVRASDGAALWALPTTDIPKGHPVVSGGMLFGTDVSGEIRAYASAGTVAGASTPTPRPLSSATAAPTAPNPFEVIGRWDSAKLGIDRPIAMAIGPNGDAYVTETGGRVSQIAPDGAVVRRWGSAGSGAGEFDFIPANIEDGAHGSIAVAADGKVYVSDSENHRVQVFTPDGQFVRQFGSFGSGDGQFLLPFDLGVDADGNVYVSDDGQLRLSKFGPDGAFLWAVDAKSDPLLDGHGHSTKIDPKGRIVVSFDEGRVVYLDPDGKVVDSFEVQVCVVSVDPTGNLYLSTAGCGGDRLEVYDPSHVLIGSWSGSTMPLVGPPEFGPNGEILALDRVGALVSLKVTLPPR